MEIVSHRQKMLDAMLRETIIFATKVISTENVETKCGRSKKKESNPFLF